jgi:hypothetical protein
MLRQTAKGKIREKVMLVTTGRVVAEVVSHQLPIATARVRVRVR